MEYSIVIPAYNEADKITSTLTQVLAFMKTFSPSFEVIVSDDGSLDNTAVLVEEYADQNPEVKLLRNPHKGKGSAIYSGMIAAEGDYIYMCDADLATPIAELKKLVHWAKDHDYDIVIASREGTGANRVGEPFYRHFIGRGFNFGVQLLALPGIKDSQCGFKLFTKKAAKHVFGKLAIYGPKATVKTTPFFGAFDVEVLYLAKKFGYSVKELPVTWNFVETPRLNFFENAYRMGFDVLKVRLNDLKGVYR